MPRFALVSLGFGLVALACTMTGCGGGSGTVAVSGTVKYSDGSVPQGEVSVIRFEPATPGPKTKAASGKIEPDGSFKLTTMEPGDGAYPGEYKVTLSVFKTYAGREQLVAEAFTKAESTTLKANVGKDKSFDFVVEKAAAK